MPTLRPTLLIGLGGTGTLILERLRDRLLLHTGEADPPEVRYLYVDSDTENNDLLRKYQGQAFPLSLSYGAAADYARRDSDRRNRLQLDRWFDPILLRQVTTQSFNDGAKGVRMFGRLLFLDSVNLPALMARIVTEVQELQGLQRGAPKIFVVASGGGGTGSGSFIDMGYLCAHLVARNTLGQVMREGIAALAAPTIQGQDVQYPRNSAAMLTELDHYCDPDGRFFAVYDNDEPDEDILRSEPYDHITLVAPTQGGNPLDTAPGPALTGLMQRIADYLFVRVTEVAQPNAPGARFADLVTNWRNTPLDGRGYPVRFQTFGVSVRQAATGLGHLKRRSQTLRRFIAYWLGPAEAGRLWLAARVLEADAVRRQRYESDLGALRALLGLPSEHIQNSSDQPRSLEEDAVGKALLQTRGRESLTTALLNAAADPVRLEDLTRWQRGQPLHPTQPGYLRGAIQENLAALSDRYAPDGIPQQVRAALQQIALDHRRGPRWCLRLLNELENVLSREIVQMQRVLDQPSTGGTPSSDEAPAGPSFAERVRGDRLLLWWQNRAAEREAQAVRSDDRADARITSAQAARANQLLEHEILAAKTSLLKQVQTEVLPDQQSRLVQFVRYLEAWQKQVRVEGALAVRQMPAGVVLLNAENAEQDRDSEDAEGGDTVVLALDDADLQEMLNLLQSSDFPSRLPQDPNAPGKTNFAALAAVRRRLNQVLENLEEQQPLSERSVLHRLLAGAEGGVDGLAEEMVAESRPLLNLNLGADGYANLRSGFPSWTAQWWLLSDIGIRDEAYQRWKAAAETEARTKASELGVSGVNPLVEQPSDTPALLALLFVRGAFSTRLLNQYDEAARAALLWPRSSGPGPAAGRAQPPLSLTATAMIDRSIHLPIPPRVRDEVEQLLIVAEALSAGPVSRPSSGPRPPAAPAPRPPQLQRVGEGSQRRHVFEYRNGAETVALRLPPVWKEAVYELALHSQAAEALRSQIRQRVDAAQDIGTVTSAIGSHINELRQKQGGQSDDQTEVFVYSPELDLQEIPVQRAINHLYAWAQAQDGRVPVPQRTRV